MGLAGLMGTQAATGSDAGHISWGTQGHHQPKGSPYISGTLWLVTMKDHTAVICPAFTLVKPTATGSDGRRDTAETQSCLSCLSKG